MMKFHVLFLSSLFLMVSFTTLGQHEDAISKGAAKYAKALQKGQWDKVLDLTYPEIVAKNGGRDNMISQAIQFDQTMLQRGFILKKAELSSPLNEYKGGNIIMCVVPMRLTFEGPLGKLYSESSLLAVSDDEGQSWTYIDMAQIQVSQLVEIFPEIPSDLDIPTKRITQD